jgi:hypothetical protein
VNVLKRIGGQDPTKNTYNLQRFVFEHSFALKVRMTDTTGKIAFGKLRLPSAIRSRFCFIGDNLYNFNSYLTISELDCFTEVIHRAGHSQNVTDELINGLIGKWLRNSSDRKGGRHVEKSTRNRSGSANAPSDPEKKDSEGSEENAGEDSQNNTGGGRDE